VFKCTAKAPHPVYAINSLVGLFAAFFMAIANAAINDGFAIYEHPSQEHSLKSFPFLLSSSEEANQMRLVSGFGIAIWCVGGFALITYMQFSLPRRREDKTFRQCCLSMVVKYSPDRPWWYLVTLVTSFLITLSVSLFEDGSWQIVYALIVLVAYYSGLLAFKPYYSWLVYYADLVASGGKILLLVSALPFQTAGAASTSASNIIPAITIIVYSLQVLMLLYVLGIFLNFTCRNRPVDLENIMADLGGVFTRKFPKSGHLEEVCDDHADALAERSRRSSKGAEPEEKATAPQDAEPSDGICCADPEPAVAEGATTSA